VLTATNVVAGTLDYMSPEQGRGGGADPSWDVWALAVIAYEMLHGETPFADALRAAMRSSALQARCMPPLRGRSPSNPGDGPQARWRFSTICSTSSPSRRTPQFLDFSAQITRFAARSRITPGEDAHDDRLSEGRHTPGIPFRYRMFRTVNISGRCLS
jgi:serine/threonine protein kinase